MVIISMISTLQAITRSRFKTIDDAQQFLNAYTVISNIYGQAILAFSLIPIVMSI